MQRRESKFGVLFRHYIRAHPPRVTTHYELKQTTTHSIPFKCYEEHQIVYGDALQRSDKGVLMRNLGGNGEPDYTYSFKDPVVVVIKFPKFFCLIPLDTFIMERKTSTSKSLTASRAMSISREVVQIP